MTDILYPISKGSFAFMTDTSQEIGVVIASYLETGGCWRVFALECHRPFTRQASQTPCEEHFSSVGEVKTMEIKKFVGLMHFCPVSQCFISFFPVIGTCFKSVTTHFMTRLFKKNHWYVLIPPTCPSENIKNGKSAMSNSPQAQVLLLTRKPCTLLVSREVEVESRGICDIV